MNEWSRAPASNAARRCPADCQAFLRPELRAPSGSRTRTSALARRHAAATSWALDCEHQVVKEPEHRVGLEPTSPHYGCGILAARRPVLFLSVGPVGIEPTSSGLRDRCITLSATVPNQSARWELNPRPASYKDAALTAELRAGHRPACRLVDE